mmetsp:Transcript_2974/g.3354  ORF Transcript_2974/g.3354 Transcript_2974/m.3354 type:complete len:123 (-) Transcript_2974:75-443(-)
MVVDVVVSLIGLLVEIHSVYNLIGDAPIIVVSDFIVAVVFVFVVVVVVFPEKRRPYSIEFDENIDVDNIKVDDDESSVALERDFLNKKIAVVDVDVVPIHDAWYIWIITLLHLIVFVNFHIY